MEWLIVTGLLKVVILLQNPGPGAGSLRLLDNCTSSAECPLSSECAPRGCEGNACLCREGFVTSIDLAGCFKGAELGRPCDGVSVVCRDKFALCTGGECRCRVSYVPSADNLRCKIRPSFGLRFALLGESCDDRTTLCQQRAEQTCDLAVSRCVCKPGLRPATPQERLAEPFLDHACRPSNFSLSLPVTELVCIDPILPETVGVGERCVSYNNCPRFADCLPRGCDGTVCVCEDGFYPTNNHTECKPVAHLTESCGPDSVCYGEGVTTACVAGRCDCAAEFTPTPDRRCKRAPEPKLEYALFGETCGQVGDKRIICEERWTACDSPVDGTCVCQYGTRPATSEERAREISNPSPCRLREYDLETGDPDQCERRKALEQCQNWRREELFWRDWFKKKLTNSEPDPPSEDWDWTKEWKRHRDKLRRCSELMPVTDDDNWSEEVREVRLT